MYQMKRFIDMERSPLSMFLLLLSWLVFIQLYRQIFHDVTLPRQRKNWSMMAFRAQLQVTTFITSVKETLFYN